MSETPKTPITIDQLPPAFRKITEVPPEYPVKAFELMREYRPTMTDREIFHQTTIEMDNQVKLNPHDKRVQAKATGLGIVLNRLYDKKVNRFKV